MLWAIAFATPFFIVFGSLSDKWGRKNIMMIGMLLGIFLYRPIFQQLHNISNTSKKEVVSNEATVVNDLPAVLTNYTDGTVLKTRSAIKNGKGDYHKRGHACRSRKMEDDRPDCPDGPFCNNGLWTHCGIFG
jgi:hypothetical protein